MPLWGSKLATTCGNKNRWDLSLQIINVHFQLSMRCFTLYNLRTFRILELTKGADIGRKTENKKEADVSSDGQNNIFSSDECKFKFRFFTVP